MQYYINLSSTNSFHKLQKSNIEQAEARTMIETEPTSTSSNTNKPSNQNKAKKSERNVKFSTSAPQTLKPIMETTQASNSNSRLNEKSLEQEEREFDIVIFAASGCVGRFLVEELALVVDKHYNSSMKASGSPTFDLQQQQFAQQVLRRRSVPSSSMSEGGLRWAIAGRSAVRLSETLCRAELSTGIRDLSKAVPVVLADLNHEKSLADLCQKTRLVINCAGPYSELGAEVLIRSCIEAQTHYIDLAHEVTFVELMCQKYSENAREANTFILNGCGFQSMSAQMGLNFTKQVADGTIDQVKIILSMSDTSALIKTPDKRQRASGIISEGMWNSLLAEKAQEISLEERLKLKVADRDQLMRLKMQAEHEEEEQQQKLLNPSGNKKQSAGELASHPSTSAPAKLLDNLSSQTRSLANKILVRKDTQSLVRDIVQFRNRSVSLAWPLRLIQGFQGKSGRGYCWPIDNMSSDEAQLIRTEMNNYELRRPDLDSDQGWRPIRCSTFLSVKNFTQVTLLFLWLFVFQVLVKFSLFRYMMRKLPQLTTFGHVVSSSSIDCGVTGSSQQNLSGRQAIGRDALSHIKYCQTFIAYGAPSDDSADPLERRDRNATRKKVQLLVSRVVGPEPNHVATATLAVQAALAVLTERDHLPCPGGVLTPGAAFSETNIIYQLRKRNIKFEVLKKA